METVDIHVYFPTVVAVEMFALRNMWKHNCLQRDMHISIMCELIPLNTAIVVRSLESGRGQQEVLSSMLCKVLHLQTCVHFDYFK